MKMLDPDLDAYLTEYRLQTPAEPISHYEDGELEAHWLVSAGFPQLTRAFEEGRELSTNELTASVAGLPKFHAEAVKQRVNALNRTVRGRTRSRYPRKPDIRDVFRDVDTSSNGTRSRSATPDSLDSTQTGDDHWNSHQIPHFVSIFDGSSSIPPTTTTTMAGAAAAAGTTKTKPKTITINTSTGTTTNNARSKQNLRRTPSAPLRGSAELFRGSHIRCDIPFYTADGIELLGFQRLGTIHIPRVRSGSDPSCSIGRRSGAQIIGAHSHNSLYNGGGGDGGDRNRGDSSGSTASSSSSSGSDGPSTPIDDQSPVNSPLRQSLMLTPDSSPGRRSSPEPVSFENLCRDTAGNDLLVVEEWETDKEGGYDVADLTEIELKKLQPLLWLELASLFDRHHVILDKRKPFKRKRKEEGNVFGVSLNALVRRDQQVTGEDSSLVPLLLQGILAELTRRGATEEGILRVPGNKQKTELLYTDIEQNFYGKYEKMDGLLARVGIHDLSALLKRWLRELPMPLLANDLVHLFYQTHEIPQPDQNKAISVLCLLLPHENRNTLREFLKFLNNIVNLQHLNKMSKHNVATIIAPSLFPPRFVHPPNKNDIAAQVQMAANCCKLTDVLITYSDQMWMVPQRLIDQARKMNNKVGMNKRQLVARKTKSNGGSVTTTNNNNNNIIDNNHLHHHNHHQQHQHHHHQHHLNSNHIHKLIV